MRALLGVSCLLALMGNDPAMSPGPVKSAASVARMSEAISGGSRAEDPSISLRSRGRLAEQRVDERPYKESTLEEW
jgi:hypothetical protein